MTRRLNPSLIVVSFSLAAVSGFVGCASSPIKDVKVQELPETSNPTQEISRLEDQLKAAKQSEVNVYAPNYYSEAADSLQEAREEQESGKDVKSILHEVAEGSAYLERGQEVAQVSKSALGEVIQARNKALEAEAPQYAREDYEKTEKELQNAVRDIEKGSTTTAQEEQNKLTQMYQQLALNATLEKNLGPSASTIQSAKKEDAEKWAPKTLKLAEQKYVEAKNAILQNPEDKAANEAMAKQAQDLAEELLRTTQRAKLIEERHPEETAAYIEQESKRIQEYQAKTSQAETTLTEQSKKLESLEARQELDQKIAKIRANFSPSEADVIREGSAITIRVKGLNFPKAKSTIPSTDYALLRKVEESIKDLDASEVKIVGNTDSTGSKAKNREISQKRAEAVKSFFSSSATLPSEKIETVGVADENPIASNKTPSGRELNRRVDVVIQTSSTS